MSLTVHRRTQAEVDEHLRRKGYAIIKRGVLVCECGHKEAPNLSEHGYSVQHDLVEVSGNTIQARGWDGNSNKASEAGDRYTLDCRSCCKEHALPEGMEIDWL